MEAKYLNRNFTEGYIWVANKHLKISSILLVIKEMKVKTTVKYHCISTRIAKTNYIKCCEDMEQLGLSYIAGGSGKGHIGKYLLFPYKIKHTPFNPLLCIY